MSEPSVPFDNELLESVRFILHSRAWGEFFAPLIQTAQADLTARLLTPGSARQEQFSDDFLRGQIQAMSALLNWGPAYIAEMDGELEKKRREAAEYEVYDERAALGSFGPVR